MLATSLGACSVFATHNRQYVHAEPAPALKIPAGLSAPPSNPETEIPKLSGERAHAPNPDTLEVPPQVSLESNDIVVMGDGALRWLLVQSTPDDLWERLSDFWAENGMALEYHNATFYIMESGWQALSGAAAPGGSAAEQVKYRLRLVQFSDEDGTEIYMTAYGREPAPHPVADPMIANRMLKRVAQYLGGRSVNADKLLGRAVPRTFAALMDEPAHGQFLKLDLPPEMAWRHVSQAVDRLGYVVIGQAQKQKFDLARGGHGTEGKDKDSGKDKAAPKTAGKGGAQGGGSRDKGEEQGKAYDEYGHQYLISESLPSTKPPQKKKKGWFSWLFFSGSDTPARSPDFVISLVPTGRSSSRLTIGTDPTTGAKTAKDRKILKDIYDQLEQG